jgi:hypothetical protein
MLLLLEAIVRNLVQSTPDALMGFQGTTHWKSARLEILIKSSDEIK